MIGQTWPLFTVCTAHSFVHMHILQSWCGYIDSECVCRVCKGVCMCVVCEGVCVCVCVAHMVVLHDIVEGCKVSSAECLVGMY